MSDTKEEALNTGHVEGFYFQTIPVCDRTITSNVCASKEGSDVINQRMIRLD